MKTEVSQSTLLITYPLPVSMRKSYIRLAVSNLSADYIKGSESREQNQIYLNFAEAHPI
jgi:hypothetical protein